VNTLGFLPNVPGSDVITVGLIADLIPIELDATFDAETHIIEAHWDINDAVRLDYIYGSYETEETILSNWTAEAVMMFGTSRPAEYEQDSHELRLTYDNDGALTLVGGVYYWESEYEIRLRSWITFAVPDVVLDIPQTTRQSTESKAVFFEGDYALTDQLTLTLGGRYTEDKKVSRQFDNLNTGPDHPRETWDEFTPRIGARYEVNDNVMVYATYSKGYRSGGFNGRVDSQDAARQAYDPETVDNYELGFKSQLMNNRMRFNGAAFLMKYDDKQEELQLPSEGATGQKTVVVNAADATIKGIELEVLAYIAAGLSLRANIGYLDTEYDEFSYTNVGGDLVDLSGLDFRRSPDINGTLDATYEWPIGGGNAWVRGSYHFLGEHFVDVSNAPELANDDQHLIDLSINYEVNGYKFSVYGRNLTDEDGYAHGFDVSGLWAYAIPRAPRTWGLEFSYQFGDQ
jgi:iron complex outermembrane receptor protein